MSKEQLSKMIDNLINDKPEQASTALHDYLTAKMQQVAGIKEGRGHGGDRDLGEMIEAFMDQEGIHNLEGERGVRNFEKLIRALNPDYSDIGQFLADNPGAFEAMIEWIQSQRSPEWKESLAAVVDDANFAIVGDDDGDYDDGDDGDDEPSPFKDPYRRH